MISMHGAIDYGSLWTDIKTSTGELVTQTLPTAVRTAIETKATAAVAPTVQKQAEAKAARVVSKGNIALTAGIGLAAGLLVAGGSWQRRALGASVGGILGGLAGLKIGLISDSA
jgi:hypothetical protein